MTEFVTDTTTAQAIREQDDYSGVRVHVQARLAGARLPFHVDVNVGDPISPAPTTVAVPRLWGGEPIELPVYPRHMVHAEKVVTAIQHGTANTRWRDFGDIWTLARQHPITADDVAHAIEQVVRHRDATIRPLAGVLDGFATWPHLVGCNGVGAAAGPDAAVASAEIPARQATYRACATRPDAATAAAVWPDRHCWVWLGRSASSSPSRASSSLTRPTSAVISTSHSAEQHQRLINSRGLRHGRTRRRIDHENLPFGGRRSSEQRLPARDHKINTPAQET